MRSSTCRKHSPRPQFEQFCRTNVRTQRQAGYAAVTVRLPMGDVTGAQFRVLADLALAYGDGSVRATLQQNLVMRWVRHTNLAGLYQRLRAAGLGRAGADTIADVTSCPGAESCRLAVTQSRGLGRELSEFIDSRPDLAEAASDASIKISGCPNGCGQHHVADVRLSGRLAPARGWQRDSAIPANDWRGSGWRSRSFRPAQRQDSRPPHDRGAPPPARVVSRPACLQLAVEKDGNAHSS